MAPAGSPSQGAAVAAATVAWITAFGAVDTRYLDPVSGGPLAVGHIFLVVEFMGPFLEPATIQYTELTATIAAGMASFGLLPSPGSWADVVPSILG